MIVLEERQFIGRSVGDYYYLTDRLSVLGASRSDHNRLAEVAMPVLLRLAEKTAFTCHLSVLDNGVVLVVAQAETAKGYSISVQVGHRSPAAESCAGVCMVAASGKWDYPNPHLSMENGGGENVRKNSGGPLTDADLTEMPNPELPGITELSAPILGSQDDRAIAAITIPFMTAIVSASQKMTMKSDILDAAELIQQRITIFLPQIYA